MMTRSCPVCSHELKAGLETWHSICPHCHFESSTLSVAIGSKAAASSIDEFERAASLKNLRIKNFREILHQLKLSGATSGKLLEVGSAHGWFLSLAREQGYQVTGIEPDVGISESAVLTGFEVRNGYFPDAVNKNEKFRVIVFNDVFEHIPDCKQTLESCLRHLDEKGLLVLNLPSSEGVFYRISKLLFHCKITQPFHRLWQVGMPSPHLHYFNSRNLVNLLRCHGFSILTSGQLSTLDIASLHKRVSFGQPDKPFRNFLTSISIMAFIPIIKYFKSDILYIVAEKNP